MTKKKTEINVDELLKKEKIIDSEFSNELSDAMLNYAVEVIKDRSLASISDGLKPVQRRILWSGLEKKYLANGPFIKSAKYVGEVMGTYH